ncbi:LysR family substrate-binding domain-containing protein [Streptomyces carpinensis]|uniref:LysR family substrate-binding domain-containing protein n=1 Tax=Streptomyces carpinensis TaxID=66369 RepID=A0ABV1VW55_9ACTN|nr:LysR family substrate-binding domain-containing protein [Streptomyces carpinensis]
MRRLRPGEAGALRVGVPPDTKPSVLCTLTESFSRRVPDVLIDLHELTTDEQLVRLREGELDAGVVRHPADTVGLDSGPLARRDLGVVLHEDHPCAEGDAPVRLRDLDGASLVIFPRMMAPRLYDHMLLACRDGGFLPGAIRHARNPDFVHGLVLAGRGVHLNEAPTTPLVSGLVWRPLEGAPLAWLTSVVWVPTRHNEAIAAFTDAVGEGLVEAGHHLADGTDGDKAS